MRSRPRHTKDSRRNAVGATLESGPTSRAAGVLGARPGTLRCWVREHRAGISRALTGRVRPAQPTKPLPSGATEARDDSSSRLRSDPPVRPRAWWEAAGDWAASAGRSIDHSPRLGYLVDALTGMPLRLRLVLVTLGWAAAVLTAALVTPTPSVQHGASVVHVLSLVVAFGAVVVIDWHGVLWLAGLRSLRECVRLAAAAGPLIWVGLAGLLASGALLNPDLSNRLTWVKLFLVLVMAVNGTITATTAQLLRGLPQSVVATSLPRRLQARVFVAATVSQISWWGAIFIGFVSAAHRS